MCRNIIPLYNFDPPTTRSEISSAVNQFLRKLSGFSKPSKTNQPVFDEIGQEMTDLVEQFFSKLRTRARPRTRSAERENHRTINKQ